MIHRTNAAIASDAVIGRASLMIWVTPWDFRLRVAQAGRLTGVDELGMGGLELRVVREVPGDEESLDEVQVLHRDRLVEAQNLTRFPSMTAGVQFFAHVRAAGSIGEAKKTRNVVTEIMISMTTTETSRRTI